MKLVKPARVSDRRRLIPKRQLEKDNLRTRVAHKQTPILQMTSGEGVPVASPPTSSVWLLVCVILENLVRFVLVGSACLTRTENMSLVSHRFAVAVVSGTCLG